MTCFNVYDLLPTKVGLKGVKKHQIIDFSGKVAFCQIPKQSRPLQSLFAKRGKVEKKGLFEKPFLGYNR